MFNRKVMVLAFLVLIVTCDIHVKAETQLYDYYQGVDNWLSNSTSYSPLGGYFNSKPNAPRYSKRAFPNMQKTSDWDNFYDYARYWTWDSKSIIQYLDSTYPEPNHLMYYLDDPSQHGRPYYDGNTANIYCAYYYIFYKRPKPKYISANINNYDYYDGSTFWVKPNKAISVYSKFFDNEGRIDLGQVYLKLSGSVNDEAYHRFYSNNVAQYINDGNALFFPSGDVNCDANGYGANFQFLISQNNADVQISSSAKNSRGIAFHIGNTSAQNWGSSDQQDWVNNFNVKTDGIAPGFNDTSNSVVDSKVNSIINLDDNLNLSGSVSNLFDIGSGTKNVYAKLYPSGMEDQAKTVSLVNNNGNWILPNIDAYSLFNSEDINIDIFTQDNVGNTGKIFSKRFDLLTVKASVVPYNNQDFIGIPTLKAGQKAILKVITTGYPDKLQITFPEEFSNLDNSLNRIVDIEKKSKLETNIEFNIPRYVQQKDHYSINVKAIKTQTEKYREDNPTLNVKGDILNGLKTMILYDN